MAVVRADLGDDLADRLTLRFDLYRGPSELLAVLVREGDLGARSVPVAALAEAVATTADETGEAIAGKVHALAALTDVWRLRLAGANGLARLPDEDSGEAVAPMSGVDPALTMAVAALRELEGRARGRVGRAAATPRSTRLGEGGDLLRAFAAVSARRALRQSPERLWPLPTRAPVIHEMRRLMRGLRGAVRVRLVGRGATRAEAVAATLAALELVRRGRCRIWQRRAYAPVHVLRPGSGPDSAAL